MPNKELMVAAIKNGTVIDHIAAGQALKIVRFLNLPNHKKVVTIGLNLPSRAMGNKDLIKVEGRELTPEEANEVSLIAPKATVNIIRNYKIAKKFKLQLPKSIAKFIVCPNLKCITNFERMDTLFNVEEKHGRLRCAYCEKVFLPNEIEKYNI